MVTEPIPSTIWGEPLAEFVSLRDDSRRPSRDADSILVSQLRTFVAAQIRDWRPDLIVVHERKGTALMRALIESQVDPLSWPWGRLISSSALDSVQDDVLRGQRILIFDDMMRTGKALAPVLTRLSALGCLSPETVRLAVFAAHEDSSRNGAFTSKDVSVAWFYRDLAPPSYRRLREQLLKFLQRSGSLMLDTEHMEVRLKLHGGVSQLVGALRRKADAIVFQSGGQRTNITVYYADDAAHRLPEARFPAGMNQIGIVKKCRVVQRAADEFAIIPICLPSISLADVDWPQDARDRRLLGNAVQGCPFARFYGVALLASLYPLQWVLRDLYASDPRMFTISLPRRSDEMGSGAGYSLEHLRVMFPTLAIDDLAEVIAEVDHVAQSEGSRRRHIKFDRPPYQPVSDARLRMDATRLLQVIARVVDERYASELLFDPSCQRRQGLNIEEVFALGERLNFDRAHISALFDILIDDGSLVTRVEKSLDADGVTRFARTFKPDGEAISDLVRHFTVQWGLPRGF